MKGTKRIGKHLPARSRPGFQTRLWLCEDCGTTTTPVRRSGPSGSSSLCNACGLRHKKREKERYKSPFQFNFPGSPSSFYDPNVPSKQRHVFHLKDYSENHMWMQIHPYKNVSSITRHNTSTDNVVGCDSICSSSDSLLPGHKLDNKSMKIRERAGHGWAIGESGNEKLSSAKVGPCIDVAGRVPSKHAARIAEGTEDMVIDCVDQKKSLTERVCIAEPILSPINSLVSDPRNNEILHFVHGDGLNLNMEDEFDGRTSDDWWSASVGVDTGETVTESVEPYVVLNNLVTVRVEQNSIG